MLRPFLDGAGQIDQTDSITRLTLPSASRGQYSDAQLDDYAAARQGVPRRAFPHRPPFRFSICARFSGEAIIGTAGFGLWNHPFAPSGGMPALPRALWFFYASPPSNMQLALDVDGYGWKAATIDATTPAALAMIPFAPIVLLLNRSRKLYHRLWPVVQRKLRIEEKLLPNEMMLEWHTYSIDWGIDRAQFSVDDRIVLETDRSPRGPLGSVIWIDNQFAVVTPTGRVKFGLLDVQQAQWLEIKTSEALRRASEV
jgi:hypothetical protein